MDPFSILVGAVGLADAGTSLAGFLTDKYKSYRDAPELLLEVAHEVEFCAGLVDVFASSVDRAGVVGGGGRDGRFVRDAKVLVERTRTIFLDIRTLMPVDRDFEHTFSKARWRFALDRKKLAQQQQRLRQAQQMFLFMEAMYRYRPPVTGGTNATGSGAKDLGAGGDGTGSEQSLTGVLAGQAPVTATGVGADGQRFEVTLTLKPVAAPESRTTYGSRPVPEGRSAIPAAMPTNKTARQGREMLESLRRSPFFDIGLLSAPKRQATEYAAFEPIAVEPRRMRTEVERVEHVRKRLEMEHREKQNLAAEEAIKWQDEAMKKGESGRNERQYDIVDSDRAKEDVDELSRLWFDDSADDYDATSSGSQDLDEDEDGTVLEPLSPTSAGSTKAYSIPEEKEIESSQRPPPVMPTRPRNEDLDPPSISPTRSPFGTMAIPPHPESGVRPPSHSPSGSKTVICDGCNRKIRSGAPRMQCRNCDPSFDLCAHCFADPETTLRHRHPKSYFLRSTAR